MTMQVTAKVGPMEFLHKVGSKASFILLMLIAVFFSQQAFAQGSGDAMDDISLLNEAG